MKSIHLFVFIGVPFAVGAWLLLLFVGSGYHFESGKYKHYLFTIAIVFILQFVVFDPIKFLIQAIFQTFFQTRSKWYIFRYGIPRAKIEQDDIRFFKMKIEWGKSRLSYNWRHRDEALNLFYKNVINDILLYGRYFILLITLVMLLNQPLKYHHSNGLLKRFDEEGESHWDIVNLEGMDNLWKSIELFVVDLFEESESVIARWVPNEMSKLISVMRLEQIRLKHRKLGLSDYVFDREKYLPGWKPFVHYPYKNKYWRIFSPWVPREVFDGVEYSNAGYLAEYPTDSSYVAQFSRNLVNSRIILDFLQYEGWLDRRTAAIFLDFTLYSVDANLFAFCRLTIECTPFGSIILHKNIESDVLLFNWKNTQNWYYLVLVLYAFQLIIFSKILVLKAWYGSLTSLLNFWNVLDIFIVILNVMVFIFIYYREESVVNLIKDFGSGTKEEYISFRSPKIMGRCAEITLALLVFCATVRLWKALLFGGVFRLYLRTLELGAADIFWALMNIMVFLIGLMFSSYLINGPSRTRSHAPLSLVHILSFSLGYSERVNPMESSEIKSKAMGVIIYALVMFGVTLILLNMLITLICIHYKRAKEEEQARPKPKINFWQFIKVEYGFFFQFFHKLRQRIEHNFRENKFFEKLQRKLWNVEDRLGVPPPKMHEWKPEETSDRHLNRLRRLRIMTDILMTQMQILNQTLDSLNIKFDTKSQKTKEDLTNS